MFDFALFFTHIAGLVQAVFSAMNVNILDVIIVIVILFYAYEGYALGFVLAFSDLMSFVLAFFLALKSYAYVAKFLVAYFSIPVGFAHAAGFFVIAFVSEILINILFRYLLRYVPTFHVHRRISGYLSSADHFLGILPGAASAFIVLAFLLTVIISLPSSPFVKRAVTGSEIGSQLIAHASSFEYRLNDVFGGAFDETLNYLTVEPQSDETVNLHFTVSDGTVDERAENEMLLMVNRERKAVGLAPVVMEAQLRKLARSHSFDMFQRGYFSHYTPEGLSPFDRMNAAHIRYEYAGENLALAPSADLAMRGLMNSPGHRANILNPNFKSLGVGAIDGGIYGIMFTQEFAD
jgi:uncharacterized protein YkwD